MKYYIKTNGTEHGPFTLEQVSAFGISPLTELRVEADNGDRWMPAAQFTEMLPLLETIKEELPAYLPKTKPTQPAPQPVPQKPVNPLYETTCPPNYFVLSIIAIVMFFPTGIPALVKSCLVKSRFQQGRFYDAEWLSRTCRICLSISYPIGIFLWMTIMLLKFK